jgi:hypothetical protein
MQHNDSSDWDLSYNKSFTMDRTIKVVDQPLSSNLASSYANQSTISNKIDTVGTWVLPSKDLEGYVSEFTDKGFIIDTTKRNWR